MNNITEHTVREIAQGFSDVAIETIVEVMQSEKASPSARLSAAETILNRAWGKMDGQKENKQQFIQQLTDILSQMDEKADEKPTNMEDATG